MGIYDTPAPGQQRYPLIPTGLSTSTAFTLSAGGRQIDTAITGVLKPLPINGGQGAQIEFWGTGAEDATFDYRIWVVDFPTLKTGQLDAAGNMIQCRDKDLQYFGGGTATLSAYAGLGSTAVPSIVSTSERAADTVTFTIGADGTTPKGIGDLILAAYDSPSVQVYSPANDTPGRLIVPRFGWPGGIIIDFDLTGATGAFALISIR